MRALASRLPGASSMPSLRSSCSISALSRRIAVLGMRWSCPQIANACSAPNSATQRFTSHSGCANSRVKNEAGSPAIVSGGGSSFAARYPAQHRISKWRGRPFLRALHQLHALVDRRASRNACQEPQSGRPPDAARSTPQHPAYPANATMPRRSISSSRERQRRTPMTSSVARARSARLSLSSLSECSSSLA